MKYALATILDQTHGYWSGGRIEDGGKVGWVIKHPDARLFDSMEEAKAFEAYLSTHETEKYFDGTHLPDQYWIEEVEDEAEFRAREDTW